MRSNTQAEGKKIIQQELKRQLIPQTPNADPWGISFRSSPMHA